MGSLNLARLLSLAVVGGSAAADRPVALIAEGVAAWPEPRPMVNGPGHWWYTLGEGEDAGRRNQPPPNQMRTLSVAQLTPANGSVGRVFEPIPAGLGAGLTGVCNAAYSPGAFMKTTSDGEAVAVPLHGVIRACDGPGRGCCCVLTAAARVTPDSRLQTCDACSCRERMRSAHATAAGSHAH